MTLKAFLANLLAERKEESGYDVVCILRQYHHTINDLF